MDHIARLNERLSKKTLNENIPLLRRAVEKGRIPKEFYKILPSITRLLQLVYPDRWDLQFQFELEVDSVRQKNQYGHEWWKNLYVWKLKIYVLIWFPEYEIRNSGEERHTIKDLFIKVPLEWRDRKPFFEKPLGARSSATMAEYTSAYRHSHLSSNRRFTQFTPFCTGSEGQVNTCLARLNSEFSDEEFQMYLYQIDVLAKWESLEGSPYKYMSSITTVSDDITTNRWLENLGNGRMRMYTDMIIDHYRETKKPVDLTWRLKKGKVVLIEDEKLEDFCKIWENPVEELGDDVRRVLGVKLENGSYTPYFNSTEALLEHETPIYFRGQPKEFVIVDKTQQEEEEQKINYTVHPYIIRYVKTKLETRANEKAARMVIDRIFSEANHH